MEPNGWDARDAPPRNYIWGAKYGLVAARRPEKTKGVKKAGQLSAADLSFYLRARSSRRREMRTGKALILGPIVSSLVYDMHWTRTCWPIKSDPRLAAVCGRLAGL